MRIGRSGRAMMAAAVLAMLPGGASGQRVAAPGGFVPQVAVGFGTAGAAASAVDAANPLPVATISPAAALADRSGAIATGGTAQTIAAANPARRGFFIQNLSTAELWLRAGGTAVAGRPSIRIAPGQLYEAPVNGVPTGAISVLGGTAGQSFTAQEW